MPGLNTPPSSKRGPRGDGVFLTEKHKPGRTAPRPDMNKPTENRAIKSSETSREFDARFSGRLDSVVRRLHLAPITLREARAYVAEHHRHHNAPQGGIFAVAAADDDCVRGVAIVGRPVARKAADGWTAEVTRLCTDGSRNAPSLLYRAAWRAVRAMGYLRLITYTLPEEGGASLRGAGFRLIGEAGGGSWSRKTRPRVDTHPQQIKLRWELSA